MQNHPHDALAGLDAPGQAMIEHRWHIFDAHLTPLFAHDRPWYIALRYPPDRQQREFLSTTLVTALTRSGVMGGMGTRQTWEQQVLLPFARDLGMVAEAEQNLILLCRTKGWFDQPVPRQRQLHRPNAQRIVRQVQTLLRIFRKRPKRFSNIDVRITALTTKRVTVRHGRWMHLHRVAGRAPRYGNRHALCRDMRTATLVERELAPAYIHRMAISRVWSLLSAYSTYGAIGLLQLSTYPRTTELLLLERHRHAIPALQQQPSSIMSDLRRDLLTLYDGMQSVHAELWKQHLLHEPPNTPTRQRYQKRLWPAQRARVVRAVAAQRGCDEPTATQLLDCLILEGLPGLIDWRCSLAVQSTQHVLQRQRTLHTLELIMIGMTTEARGEIERLIQHLLTAMHEADLPISLGPLLTEYPSSLRRRQWGRRLMFGLPSVMRRKQRRRRQPKEGWRPRNPLAPTRERTAKHERSEHRLIARFAQAALLDEHEAADRLRMFLTYGILGLLPRDQWAQTIDQRLWSWLRLIKFGRLDGTLAWTDVYHHLCVYSHDLHVTPPSAQVARAIFNSIAKPSYWHGGKGSAVDGVVRQRATLTLTKQPRLHRRWLVIPITLNVSFAPRARKRFYLLLVVDEGSQLPVGGWLSEHIPGSREVALAIYQAIWHPGTIDWPLHGMPEAIRIPETLLKDGTADLQRAAAHLLIELEIVEKVSLEGKSQLVQMRDALRKEGPIVMQDAANGPDTPTSILLQALLTSLIPAYFPYHRPAPVWPSIRKYGVAMPGHDTLAAGWLLPQVANRSETVEDGVLSNGRLYRSPWFHSMTGQHVTVRIFPFFYPKDAPDDPEPGIFVEIIDETERHLYYLDYSYA